MALGPGGRGITHLCRWPRAAGAGPEGQAGPRRGCPGGCSEPSCSRFCGWEPPGSCPAPSFSHSNGSLEGELEENTEYGKNVAKAHQDRVLPYLPTQRSPHHKASGPAPLRPGVPPATSRIQPPPEYTRGPSAPAPSRSGLTAAAPAAQSTARAAAAAMGAAMLARRGARREGERCPLPLADSPGT